MWGDKKPEAPEKKAVPQQPQPSQQAQQTKPTVPSANAPAVPGEAKTMAPNDSTYPSTSSGNTARLGSSLHVKGEITGNEDLLIDGTVEGLVQLEDRKLTGWKVDGMEEPSSCPSTESDESTRTALLRNFEFRLPLSWLLATPASGASPETSGEAVGQAKQAAAAIPPTSRLRLRFSLWHNRLPMDALPVEGWIELQLLSEAELGSGM